MNEETLERVYQEGLEERIIVYLAETCDFSYEKAISACCIFNILLRQVRASSLTYIFQSYLIHPIAPTYLL